MKLNLKKYWSLLTLTPILLIIDQWTKAIVHKQFYLGESIPVIAGWFHLTYVRNTGAAFGFLAQAPSAFRVPFFTIIPLVALGVIAYLFKKLDTKDQRSAIALSLIISGAIGNFIDRMRYGFVVDFLDFHWQYQVHFPAFNVADSAICVGVGLLMLDVIKNPQKH